MSDTEYDSSDSDASVATVEAGPHDVSGESASDTEETPETSSGSEDGDGVQCISCYRYFPRALWYDWPVVNGREGECIGCCNRL